MSDPKKLFLKFLSENYKEEITLAKESNKQEKVNVDYTLLNNFFNDEIEKNFFDLTWEQIISYAEKRINKKRTAKNYISVKLVDVPPNVLLHDLDTTYNGELISSKAMIKNITPINVQLKKAAYECRGCARMYFVDVESSKNVLMPNLCPSCGGRSFRLASESSEYRNTRYVKLEEPLEFRQGGVSREFKGYMQDYLACPSHNLKAGDVCDILGKFNIEQIEPNKAEFEFMINLHNIAPVDDAFEDYRITDSDKKMIRELSHQEDIYERLVATLAPEIYGYDTVKKGLLLQLFEGNRPVNDTFKNDGMDRWTIHVLLIGDPGIGKSQLISAINKRAPKIISIAGTSTSQAGLTVSAVKDELTGTWAMEAGAVVLADTGLLCIDEYDKLSAKTQKSLNEPMEQLSVSSAKAGLVQSMSARTSVLACANPKYSKFNRYKSVKEQIDIPDSNLSRFDLVFALEDIIDEKKDRELAINLLNNEKFVGDVEVIDTDLFKKYITYAKMECFPTLSKEAANLLTDFYVDTRSVAQRDDSAKPITARDLKAISRLSIARAKTELRDVVTVDDAREAILIYSKALESIGLSPESAGVLEQVWSNEEVKLVNEAESMLRTRISMNDGVLDDNVLSEVRFELGPRCKEVGCELDLIFEEAVDNVRSNKV
ncbi:MAG: minichromosome maintenance protein MCM [Methanobrevibacter sp.]|nr:minichromosome maintenance protein MCM [Methanobrevibacter sp.]MBQ9024909.1 minichromosome maintenance protein MCM [Methanobrevibacter sp.]